MDEKIKCKLPGCTVWFVPEHGNQQYCSTRCYHKAKTLARKNRYGSTKHFVPILASNDKILQQLYDSTELEIAGSILKSQGFDFSMVRKFRDANDPNIIILDSGEYFLTTCNSQKLYKIKKHE